MLQSIMAADECNSSNPYIAGNPVGGGQAFVGRADVLSSVLRVLSSHLQNALVLYGQRIDAREFQIDDFFAILPGWEPDLKELAYGGWRIRQRIMLAWLADELPRAIRSESAFGQWLQASELEGHWSHGQRTRLWEVGQSLSGLAADLFVRMAQHDVEDL